ncbi:MAG: putative toxin-antitoxin system toxin component, PIN family [Candidatus Aenigmarchaeota archaeon]|nr:putative toxin-antitoxin system toxin component, PIN family [Candidatus Aenigmarchaeota archaeon]
MLLRATVDTNVLVSATISEGNPYKILKLSKEGKIALVISLDILKEFKGVISRPRFGFSQEQINNVLKHIISISEIVVPTTKVNFVKDDPDDNKILEAAVSGKSEYIVSGDRHLLDIKMYNGVKIVKPAEFLNLLG